MRRGISALTCIAFSAVTVALGAALSSRPPMVHKYSKEVLDLRRQRAIDRGYLKPRCERTIPVPRNISSSAASAVLESMDVHAEHAVLSGRACNYARDATKEAKALLSENVFKSSLAKHSKANKFKHSAGKDALKREAVSATYGCWPTPSESFPPPRSSVNKAGSAVTPPLCSGFSQPLSSGHKGKWADLEDDSSSTDDGQSLSSPPASSAFQGRQATENPCFEDSFGHLQTFYISKNGADVQKVQQDRINELETLVRSLQLQTELKDGVIFDLQQQLAHFSCDCNFGCFPMVPCVDGADGFSSFIPLETLDSANHLQVSADMSNCQGADSMISDVDFSVADDWCSARKLRYVFDVWYGCSFKLQDLHIEGSEMQVLRACDQLQCSSGSELSVFPSPPPLPCDHLQCSAGSELNMCVNNFGDNLRRIEFLLSGAFTRIANLEDEQCKVQSSMEQRPVLSQEVGLLNPGIGDNATSLLYATLKIDSLERQAQEQSMKLEDITLKLSQLGNKYDDVFVSRLQAVFESKLYSAVEPLKEELAALKERGLIANKNDNVFVSRLQSVFESKSHSAVEPLKEELAALQKRVSHSQAGPSEKESASAAEKNAAKEEKSEIATMNPPDASTSCSRECGPLPQPGYVRDMQAIFESLQNTRQRNRKNESVKQVDMGCYVSNSIHIEPDHAGSDSGVSDFHDSDFNKECEGIYRKAELRLQGNSDGSDDDESGHSPVFSDDEEAQLFQEYKRHYVPSDEPWSL